MNISKARKRSVMAIVSSFAFLFLFNQLPNSLFAQNQNMLGFLADSQNYQRKRVSSADPTGGNRDFLTIPAGQTAVLADLKGPAIIDHIWMTIAAEPFYGRKLVLRIYWDGEDTPSVEVPVGDFFAVGHGLERNLISVPIIRSSEGRALNAYWTMPFRWSARVTITNEGSQRVSSFYYQIDYRQVEDIKPDVPYFHAQYRQEFPCEADHNYLILEAVGRGHYAGCVLSVLQRSIGWWGEGDDIIFIDGSESPAIIGTGSEDYFSDAWGMREGNHLYYGCPLQEEDFQAGAKASVFRFHLPDPVPFFKSIKVTIEHGHANDRSDYYSSVAFWYQTEPHKPFPPLPSVDKRLPLALAAGDNFFLPVWLKVENGQPGLVEYQDKVNGTKLLGSSLTSLLTSYYDQSGQRYQAIISQGAVDGTRISMNLQASLSDLYDIRIYYLKGPAFGNWRILKEMKDSPPAEIKAQQTDSKELPSSEKEKNEQEEKRKLSQETEVAQETLPANYLTLASVTAYAPDLVIDSVTLKAQELVAGENNFVLEVAGKEPKSAGFDLAIIAANLIPTGQNYALDWNIIGPFEAKDMSYLATPFPPETEINLKKSYPGKNNQPVGWQTIKARTSGYVALNELLQPNEQALAYGLTYVYSPEERQATLLLGSDDGVKLWVNDLLVHTNPAYRGAYPDQDRVSVNLKAGWNKILIKVLQGAGGWGFYLRIPDPKGEYRWSLRPEGK
ncbi:MAG TPA: DUF2961 domain-containing protein [Candidatus Saccharicenans sp.]|nr:DUF2961 domain-containing protein [Candidatus Saccharicenans sp.]